MVLVSLPDEKRLQSRRAVKRLAKSVRASIRSPRWYDMNHDFWLTLEKSQQDDFSRMCSRKLLLIRLEIKDILRGLNSGECSVEDLVLNTRLSKDSILAILRKHGYGIEREATCNVDLNSTAAECLPKENNVKFDLPVLDISDIRNDRRSPETPEIQHVVEEVNPDLGAHTPLRRLVEDTTVFIEESPREVTDSSAEISDLAKRLGARLCQEGSLIDQLRNISREKSFVEQLREVVTSSSTTQTRVKEFQFIPSKPLTKPSLPVTIHCKETDVQTSIRFEAPILAIKQTCDNATDLPSLDYITISEIGAVQELPGAFVIKEDVSSSTISSDQSAGQVSDNFRSRLKTTISIARDGSAQFIPSKTVKLSKFVEEPLNSTMKEEASFSRTTNTRVRTNPGVISNACIPNVYESPWRPSSRRLCIEEVDISTSQDSDSLEVVSVGKAKHRLCRENDSSLIASNVKNPNASQNKSRIGVDESESELLIKEYSGDSSYQDDEHTYNQVSQIVSE